MNYLKAIVATACLAGVSACGGGGGGIASAPTPTPAPGPSTNTTLVDLQFSQEFLTYSAYIPYSLARGTGVAEQRPGVPAQSGGAKITYNASTRTYTVAALGLTPVSFGPGDRQASSNGTITNYERVSGNRQENLALFVPGPTNSELVLTYATYGAYQSITDRGASLDVDTAFFTYGIPTANADLPRSGTADYTTKIDGQLADRTGVYVLAGSSSFQANFAAATVAMSMSPVGQNVVTGDTRSFGTQTVNGSITNGSGAPPQFGGNGGGGGYSVGLSGQFYGPAAAEIGGTFLMTGPNGAIGTGALVGRKN